MELIIKNNNKYRKLLLDHLAGVDAFDEGSGSVGGAYGGAEDAVDVDVVNGDLARLRRGAVRMVPADQDRLVQLAFQSQLARRRD